MKIKYNYFFLILLGVFMGGCSQGDSDFDEQAHRGGRGLMPENTIKSQKNAIDYGSTLEMDLQMSKDKKIVVSHDAYFNSLFCLSPSGDTMSKKEGEKRLIYDMVYDSVAQYDCGSKPHPDFADQKNTPATKPLLSVLIDSVEAYAKTKNHTNHYNIELKTSKKADGKHYSNLEEYIDSTMSIINGKGIASRTMIQSFDKRALNIVHNKWPDMDVSYLVWGKEYDNAEDYIEDLGFKPEIFSPNYHSSTKGRIENFHDHGIRVIPWTPNTIKEMQQLKDMGVDGEITDYPNYYSELK